MSEPSKAGSAHDELVVRFNVGFCFCWVSSEAEELVAHSGVETGTLGCDDGEYVVELSCMYSGNGASEGLMRSKCGKRATMLGAQKTVPNRLLATRSDRMAARLCFE
jgi:hypothetical protein